MLLVDSADTRELATTLHYPGIDGVTTNPNLVARAVGVESLSSQAYAEHLVALTDVIETLPPPDHHVRQIMVQPVGSNVDILRVARQIQSRIHPQRWQLWIKLLPDWTALALIPELQALGIRTLVTATYTATQAEVAFSAHADAIAVYVGRLVKADPNWTEQLTRITAVAQRAGRRALLASFPDRQTLEMAVPYSADLTIPAPLVHALMASPLSSAAMDDFAKRIR
jgi:transaldolase